MEEWQKRDQNFVEGAFENELKEAILASKIEYEENKELYEAIKKETEVGSIQTKKKNFNKKGLTTMTLDQFNVLPSVWLFDSISS